VRIDAPAGEGIVSPARRSPHDAVRVTVTSTSRGQLGAVTSRGRVIRFSPVDLPAVPPNSVQLAAGVRLWDYLGLSDQKEELLSIVSLSSEDPIALGTAQGVVKRIQPGGWPSRPDFEVIALKAGDSVVGAAQCPDGHDLVFVTSDARLLHFPAAQVRPQGLAAGGMAGVNLADGARVLFFGSAEADAVVATVSIPEAVLAGTDPGRGKVTALAEFPGKGRATAGVRAQSFLKGESALAHAWVGPGPALAVSSDGSARNLPDPVTKRDASGTVLDGVIAAIGRRL